MPQFQRVQAIVNLLDITRLTGKGISISCSGSFTQESRVIICQKASQNFLGKLRVAEGFPIFQLCFGERGGNEQASVRCQTAENASDEETMVLGSRVLWNCIIKPPIYFSSLSNLSAQKGLFFLAQQK